MKKAQKLKSQALSNYELANKLKKTYGLSNDGSSRLIGPSIDRNQFEVEAEVDDIDQDEDEIPKPASIMLPPPPVAQVGMMLQPDLDPYSLIPQQFHNTFNIKPPHHMIITRQNPTDIMTENQNYQYFDQPDQGQKNDQETGFSYNIPQRFSYQMPLYYPPYNYYFYRY